MQSTFIYQSTFAFLRDREYTVRVLNSIHTVPNAHDISLDDPTYPSTLEREKKEQTKIYFFSRNSLSLQVVIWTYTLQNYSKFKETLSKD